MSTRGSHKEAGPLGWLIILLFGVWFLFKVVIPNVWHFLKASWPAWGLFLLTLVLLAAVRHKKKNIFYKAADKVLMPIAVALGALLTLELLFGIFKSFFDAGRVSNVENTILKLHFAIKHFEDGLGYFVPVIVAISVVFLCLSVGDWKISSGITKAKDAFAFLSLAVLIMSSFTFFGSGAANILLDWETDQNQRWYKMALADEERSIARIVASREVNRPLRHLDADSKKHFEDFFSSLRDICKLKQCFRGKFDSYLSFYGKPSVEAFKLTIEQRASDDLAQLTQGGNSNAAATQSSNNKITSYKYNNNVLDDIARVGATQTRIPARRHREVDEQADIDLHSSKLAEENLLSMRAFSEQDRDKQREVIARQRNRTQEAKAVEWAAKRKITEAFASVVASAVPDAEGIVGAYISELVDDAAEWVVRPLVNHMYKDGFRWSRIEDLGLAIQPISSRLNDTFDNFHAAGTRPSETSQFNSTESVGTFFENREKEMKDLKVRMDQAIKEAEEGRADEKEE